MTMKPFEIQGAELVLGGVQLQAGNTGVVIPGVTQATNYRVDEVKDTDGDQSIIFNDTPIIIDIVTFNDYVNNMSPTDRAVYQAELDDDGYIDEIEVTDSGVYSQQDYNVIMGASPIYAYTGSATLPFNPFVSEDWTSIPFRVKMRAGEVESIADQISSGDYNVTVSESGVVTMNTARGSIEFGAQPEPGGPTHLHIMRPTGAEGATDLYFGDDYNYVKMPSSSYSAQGVEIGSSLNEGTVHTWRFGTDGNLTLPEGGDIQDSTGTSVLGGSSLGSLSVNVNTIQGGAAGQVGTSYTKTVDNNGNDYSTGGGSLGFLNFGADDEVEQVQAGWTVTFASGETRTVSQDAWQPIGTYWTISFNNSYNWSGGDVMPITFSSPDYEAGSDPVVVLSADNNNWTFDNTGNLTIPSSSGGFIKTATNGAIGIAAINGGTDNPAQMLSWTVGETNPSTIISTYANSATILTNVNGATNTWEFTNTGTMTTPGAITSTGKIGYANGGSATQSSSGQSVTINQLTGKATMASVSYGVNQTEVMLISCNKVSANDYILAQVVGTTNAASFNVSAFPHPALENTIQVLVRSLDTITEALTIQFFIMKAPVA